MGSAQIGKTVVGNIFVGGSMDMDPTISGHVHPTDDNAVRWSKLKLLPMLRGTTALNRASFRKSSRDGATRSC
jgi:phage terminase large subunit GpA-like protein